MFEIRYEYMITREFADSVHLQRRPRDVSLLRCDDNFRRGVHRLIANTQSGGVDVDTGIENTWLAGQ